jgi:hypothetical protein
MGPRTWSVVFRIVEAAIDEVVTYIKDKSNGGNHDSTGTGKTK